MTTAFGSKASSMEIEKCETNLIEFEKAPADFKK